MSQRSPEPLSRKARLRWVLISEMVVNPLTQRALNPNWVAKIAAELDLESIGHPILSYRDGHFYIIDGQHRIEALREAGFGDEKLQCWVYDDLTADDEAEAFLQHNNKLNVRSMDRFKVAVQAGRAEQEDIDRIVRANGCVVTDDQIPGAIRAVATLEKIYRRSGAAVLGRTIRVVRDSYGDEGLEGPILDGIGHLCARFNGALPEDYAVAKLSQAYGGSGGLLNKARTIRLQTGNQLPHCVAAAAVDVINVKATKAQRLPSWWKS